MTRLSAVVFVLLVSSLMAAQQPLPWAAEYGYQPDEIVDFRFGGPGVPMVPIVSVQIQSTALPLIFDTGTNGYASLDGDLMTRMQMSIKKWDSWLDSAGKPITKVPVGVASNLDLGPIHLTNVEIAGLGPESIMGKRSGFVGTLGWWSYQDSRITLDYRSNKIAISRRRPRPTLKACPTRYITHFVSPPALDGLTLVEAEVTGHKIYVEVDTGKSSTEIDPKLLALRQFGEQKSGYLIDGIDIGPFEIRTRFGRMFSGFASFSTGLEHPVYVGVGSDFLADYLLTIDYPNHLVILEKESCH